MTKDKLKELLMYGQYILKNAPPQIYREHRIGKDYKSFIDGLNATILETHPSSNIMVDSFISDITDPGTLTIRGVLVHFFDVIDISKFRWTQVPTSDGYDIIYIADIEDMPELEVVRGFLDGDGKHPIYLSRSNDITTTISLLGLRTHYADFIHDCIEKGSLQVQRVHINVIG